MRTGVAVRSARRVCVSFAPMWITRTPMSIHPVQKCVTVKLNCHGYQRVVFARPLKS